MSYNILSRHFIFNIFLLFFLFSSCTNRNEVNKISKGGNEVTNEDHARINNSISSSFVELKDSHIPIFDKCTNYDNRLSRVASKIQFVAIDSTMLLRDFFVYDIALSDEYIFLSSHDYIYQYDRNGKFVRKVGGKGMGPKEYVQLSPPLSIDQEHKLLYATDEIRGRMMVYDFDGNLYKINSIKKSFHALALLDSTTFAVQTTFMDRYQSNALLLALLDNNGKEIKTFKSNLYPIPRDQMGDHGPQVNYLWSCRNNFYTMEYGNDTIYQITKDALHPRAILTGKLALKKEELFKKEQGDKKIIAGPLFRPNSAIFESDHFIIFRISQKEEMTLLAYNKETGEIHQTSRQKNIAKPEYTNDTNYSYYMDDLVSGMPFYPLYQSQGQAIAMLSAPSVVENKQKILDYIQAHPSEEGKRLEEIVNRLEETDNSLLMIVEFK